MNTPAASFALALVIAAAIAVHTAPRPPKASGPPARCCCQCPGDACNCGPVCRCHLATKPPANQ